MELALKINTSTWEHSSFITYLHFFLLSVEFDNYMQQDAHEFLNFLINHINESLVAEQNQANTKGNAKNNPANGNTAVDANASLTSTSGQRGNASVMLGVNSSTLNISSCGSTTDGQNKTYTWINEIFQGILTSETRCLNCETVTSKDEDFFDLSIDVEQNTSITSCLRNFSNTETLCSDNKFKCDSCSTYQEAHVRIIPILYIKRTKV